MFGNIFNRRGLYWLVNGYSNEDVFNYKFLLTRRRDAEIRVFPSSDPLVGLQISRCFLWQGRKKKKSQLFCYKKNSWRFPLLFVLWYLWGCNNSQDLTVTFCASVLQFKRIVRGLYIIRSFLSLWVLEIFLKDDPTG